MADLFFLQFGHNSVDASLALQVHCGKGLSACCRGRLLAPVRLHFRIAGQSGCMFPRWSCSRRFRGTRWTSQTSFVLLFFICYGRNFGADKLPPF